MYFISFYYLNALVRTSSKILIIKGKDRHPCFVLNLKGNGLYFSILYGDSYRFVIYALYLVEEVSSYCSNDEALYHE